MRARTVFLQGVIVVLNIIVMAIEHHNMPEDLRLQLYWLDSVFTLVYCIEAAVKMKHLGEACVAARLCLLCNSCVLYLIMCGRAVCNTGLGTYFRDNMNLLDFVICVLALISLIMDAVYSELQVRLTPHWSTSLVPV
jgi:hypothetical protein